MRTGRDVPLHGRVLLPLVVLYLDETIDVAALLVNGGGELLDELHARPLVVDLVDQLALVVHLRLAQALRLVRLLRAFDLRATEEQEIRIHKSE